MGLQLQKASEKVGLILTKNNIPSNVVARVVLALDISGSMSRLYQRGVVQTTVERILPLAMRFDDNKTLDVWTFSSNQSDDGGRPFDQLEGVTEKDYEDYVNRKILNSRNVSKWGGTMYAPVMQDIIQKLFSPKQSGGGLFGFGKKTVSVGDSSPAYVAFITDGDNSDESATEKVLNEAKQYNLYWQFVGIGTATNFRFLRRMADDLPNAGFTQISNFESAGDDELYTDLLNPEFLGWIKNHGK